MMRSLTEEEWRKKFDEAAIYFERHKDEILSAYEGHYVAIFDGNIVDYDKDNAELSSRIYEKYGNHDFFMPYVSRESLVLHMPSPRIREEAR